MKKENISKKILYWYDNNKRILPWRKTTSKKNKYYYTLVSEFMLQQTQVKTVIPYFEKFVKKIPNLKELSEVNDVKLMKCWQGLGYYSRARNLKKAAKKIIYDFKGHLPSKEKTVKIPYHPAYQIFRATDYQSVDFHGVLFLEYEVHLILGFLHRGQYRFLDPPYW